MQKFSLHSLTFPATLIAVGTLVLGFFFGFGIRSEMNPSAVSALQTARTVQSGKGVFGVRIPGQGSIHVIFPRSGMIRGMLGSVEAISSSSVTVKDLITQKNTSLALSSSTVITDTAGANLRTGEVPLHACVLVRSGSSGTHRIARSIRVFSGSFNPCTMLAGALPGPQGSSDVPGFPFNPLFPGPISTPSPSPSTTY
ncbi:MAG: hypothetical protein ACP5OR_01355 [Candidatus Dormibacteria bacterium]